MPVNCHVFPFSLLYTVSIRMSLVWIPAGLHSDLSLIFLAIFNDTRKKFSFSLSLSLSYPSPHLSITVFSPSHSPSLTTCILTFFLPYTCSYASKWLKFALSVMLFSTTVPPSQPRNVSIQSMDIGPTFARVCWQPPSSRGIPTVSRYVITATPVDSRTDSLTFNTADATRDFNVTGLAPGTRYEFRVAAISESEEVVWQSLPSDPFSATTNLTGTLILCACVCVGN